MSPPSRSDSMSVSSASITLPVIGAPPSLPFWPPIRIFGTTSTLRLLDRLGEAVHHLLRELEPRPAVGAHLLLDGHRLGDADARGPLGLGAGERLDPLGLAFAEDADLLGLGRGQRLDLRRLLLGALRTRPCPGWSGS